MKKLLIIFIVMFCTNSFALMTNDAENMCGIITSKMQAVFEPASYTCNVGYFLPADTTGCQPCPTDYTCPGGTFDFNPKYSQGAKRPIYLNQNAVHACSSNNVHWKAVFDRITMNLNFDDGNGNVTSTTCEYGDTIVIPDTVPTRTGYNFTGWVVRENNINE